MAERSSLATRKIVTLVKTIQDESTDVAMALDQIARDVADGSALAHRAGAALADVEAASRRTAERTEIVSRAADRLAQSLTDLDPIPGRDANSSDAIERLIGLVQELWLSVAKFHLPGDGTSSKRLRSVGPLRAQQSNATAIHGN